MAIKSSRFLVFALLGLFLGLFQGLSISFWLSSSTAIMIIVWIPFCWFLVGYLFYSRQFLFAIAMLVGKLPALWVASSLAIALNSGSMGEQFEFQLTDSCEDVRSLLTCIELDDLSKSLLALRCLDSSLFEIRVRALLPGYTDTRQQCFGG